MAEYKLWNALNAAKNYKWIELSHSEKIQVELLANLDKVTPAGAVILVSYPRIEGATGLPARVWAISE